MLAVRIVDAYSLTRSIRGTAKLFAISNAKVRRVLLSSGVMPDSELTLRIVGLHNSGFGPRQIAESLNMRVNAVFSHLPYIRGMYNSDTPTINALHIRNYRNRNRLRGISAP